MLQLTGLGAEESDSDSDMDVPDISHVPAVENTLDDLQYAELLLRYPQPTRLFAHLFVQAQLAHSASLKKNYNFPVAMSVTQQPHRPT